MTPRKKISWIQRAKILRWFKGQITRYQDEPLAEDDEKENGEREEEADMDGLTPAVLESRYEREVSLESWYVLFTVILCTQDSFSPL